MKNSKGSTLMIVMLVFTLFAILSAALSILLFMNLQFRLKSIENRSLMIETTNDAYLYLKDKDSNYFNTLIEEFNGYEEDSGYLVNVTFENGNYRIDFQKADNEKNKVNFLISFIDGNYQILAWSKG
jgi:predicted membrane protein